LNIKVADSNVSTDNRNTNAKDSTLIPKKVESTSITQQIIDPMIKVKNDFNLNTSTEVNVILYLLILYLVSSKVVELWSALVSLFVIPKKLMGAYSYFTKEDLLILVKVDNLMHELMGASGADRVTIAKFHNGTTDKTGMHQTKLSIMYETNKNLIPIKSIVQDVLIENIKEELTYGSTYNYTRIIRGPNDAPIDRYFDRYSIEAKDYKLLEISNYVYGILELHYTDIPTYHWDEHKDLNRRIKSITTELEIELESLMINTSWLQRLYSRSMKKIKSIFPK